MTSKEKQTFVIKSYRDKEKSMSVLDEDGRKLDDPSDFAGGKKLPNRKWA